MESVDRKVVKRKTPSSKKDRQSLKAMIALIQQRLNEASSDAEEVDEVEENTQIKEEIQDNAVEDSEMLL